MSLATMSPAPSASTLRTGSGRLTVFGALASVVLLGMLILWAALTPIAGAVVAAGQTVVHGKPKKVQSLDGGIVASIEVASGDRVKSGQVLLRLDPTMIDASLEIARTQLAGALATRARLEAEQLGKPPEFRYADLPFPAPDTAVQEAGQRQIYAARAELMAGRADRLTERRAEIGSQVDGIRGQIEAKRESLALMDEDLATVSRLKDEGLALGSRRRDLARGRAELVGQIAQLEASQAELSSTLRDAELQLLQDQREFKEGVVTELREARAKIDELVPQILTLQAQRARIEIRAPASGVVHELAVTTVGGVISPGEVLLQVLPLDKGLDFELRLDPRNVDQVHSGQAAQVVLAALDPRATPKLAGSVASVSPDILTDPRSGVPYYRVELNIPPEELARLGDDVQLIPGMPVEAYLETGDRTVLRYMLKPVTAQIDRAFREE